MKKTFFQLLFCLLVMGVALTVFAQDAEQSGYNLFAQELEDVASRSQIG